MCNDHVDINLLTLSACCLPSCSSLPHDPLAHLFSIASSSSCSWLARTDPRDVARVESKTVIVTRDQRDTVPTPLGGAVSQLGRWMSPEEFDKAMAQRFPGCMKGTTVEDLWFNLALHPYQTAR